MLQFHESELPLLIAHFIGNPVSGMELFPGKNSDSLIRSNNVLKLAEFGIEESFAIRFLTQGFISENFMKFTKQSSVFPLIKKIFSSTSDNNYPTQKTFIRQSQEIARHLFEVTNHPKILTGDLFIGYVSKLSLNNEFYDGIVIMKCESTAHFLSVEWDDETSSLMESDGFPSNKVDKAALIINNQADDGYRILIIDNNSINSTADYWNNLFLDLIKVDDNYFKTVRMLDIIGDFVKDEIPEHYECSIAEQLVIIYSSINYFNSKESFELEVFNEEVLKDQDIMDQFIQHLEFFDKGQDLKNFSSVKDSFNINFIAVRRHKGKLKFNIKLDRNFELKINSNPNMIERGFDSERDLNFYKVYFNNESKY